jgi:nucleoside 2-deoxyribosyltransferase
MDEITIFAFVLMPFKPEFNDTYKFGIKEPSAELGILAERVDEQIYNEGILERIYRQIDTADIVIADMTGQNSNVFYEVGYAHAKGKLCIHLTSNADDIPFDLKHKRHIVYNGSINTLKDRLVEELIWAKTEIQNVRKSQIQVALKSASGDLEKTKYSATGNLKFKIDLHNESSKPSSEIESVYFYSTKSWTLTQDGKECPSTKSDIKDYEQRHYLASPVRKLHKNSWAQITFNARKTLASAFKGEELKSSYKITGRSTLRLITSEGHFDYEIHIDTTVDEFPF